ncbi:MAG: hypothetical protein COB02_13130 [Candidatus Cloacimonadota bacterium]|nr:MAG: hypothetical protein COB02_13130 [Candidatus Cloacimonadota bacterium]
MNNKKINYKYDIDKTAEENNIPAIAIQRIENGIKSYEYYGKRANNHDGKVESEDLWHIGSCSKSMVAYLIASLVDQGNLSFTDSLSKFFPKNIIHSYRGVKIKYLLTHTSGIPEVIKVKNQKNLMAQTEKKYEIEKVRNGLIEDIFKLPPDFMPAEKFEYSNSNYVILGQIAAKVTNMSWEESMKKYVFTPLKMNSCGFGASATKDLRIPDQPWGHKFIEGKLTSIPNLTEAKETADNPVSIAAAGSIHCDFKSWEAFLIEMLNSAKGNSDLLKSSTASYLFKEYEDGVANGGWGVSKKSWANGLVYTMVGSNELNYAMYIIIPDANLILMGVVNSGSDVALKGLTSSMMKLLNEK